MTPSEPWYAKDFATGGWIGFGVSLAQAMAKDMGGSKVAFVETTWANAPAGLQAGQFDVMFVLDPTPARALAIEFPFAPVLYYALGYMAKERPADTSWAALDQPGMLGKLWRGGLQSSNIDGNTRLCTATSATGLMANFGADGPVASYVDVDQADLLCLYGHNVAEA